MSHIAHERLEGYDKGNVLHDGCSECEYRASLGIAGVNHLDTLNARGLWQDMLDGRWPGGEGIDRNVSRCDRKLIDVLYDMAVLMERMGTDPRTWLA